MKNVLKLLSKSVLILLELTAALSAADAATTHTLIISNEEMDDITKTVKSLKESGLLIKGVSETIKNEVKN